MNHRGTHESPGSRSPSSSCRWRCGVRWWGTKKKEQPTKPEVAQHPGEGAHGAVHVERGEDRRRRPIARAGRRGGARQTRRLRLFYGEINFQAGKFAEAEKAFQKALELDPYLTDAHLYLGAVYQEMDRLADAERQYLLALNNPAYPPAGEDLPRSRHALSATDAAR